MVDGFRYVRHHPELRGAITAKLGWGLAGGMQVLLPVIGKQLYRLPHDPQGQLSISLLFAAGGLGTALGPVVARRFTGREIPRIRWAIAYAFVMGGVFYLCMATVPTLLGGIDPTRGFLGSALHVYGPSVLGLSAMCFCLFLARFHGAVIWVFSTVLLQMLSEDRYRGRVFAAETSLFTASMMASSVAAGFALDSRHMGVGPVILAMAVVSLVVGVIWVVSLLRGRNPDDAPPGVPAYQSGGTAS
jgi:MFS family permease